MILRDLADRVRVAAYLRVWQSGIETCKRFIDPQRMYQSLRQSGADYGPSFQAIKSLHCNSGSETRGDIDLLECTHHSTGSQGHVIHPATLDAVTHLIFAPLCKRGSEALFANIPTAIKKLWVSHTAFTLWTATSVLFCKTKI